jgi:hypothetical protein
MSMTLRGNPSRIRIILFWVFGFVVIALLHLLLTIMTSQAVYELSDLKQEKRELDITSQILSEQVSSLSSQQNLLNTAGKLGMVVNTNPVFLSLESQKVLGTPKPATNYSSQGKNLIANSSIIKASSINAKATTASVGVLEKIVEESTKLTSSIPTSPTR